jgi:antitoxin component YwqK of YwqJK toxin-antitoxin module
MVQKEHLLNKFIILLFCQLIFSCSETVNKKSNNVFEKVDISHVPNTTIFLNDNKLKLDNGVYYFNNKPYSGFIKEMYQNDTVKSFASYYQGRQHGTTKTFFENGKLETERNYKNGIGYGRHYGYWANGNMKFDFSYFNDKREGMQKQWYESGSPYCFLMYKNDIEDGMQKAWRENGKPYINYESKDGHRYGLQKANLCYTLRDGQIKTKSNEN